MVARPFSLGKDMPPQGGKEGQKTMPFYSITSRAHPSEIQIFEDWLVLILPFVKERIMEFHYSVENDLTCDRHLHCVVEDNALDVTNFKKKLETKKFKKFKDSIKNNLTDFEQLTFCKKIKENEETINIGYIFKDTNSRQGSSEFGDPDYISQCIKEYFTDERIKARGNETNDINIVTTKNFYAKVQDFVKKNELTYNDHMIYLKMIRNNYGFINISTKQITRGFRELKIMNNKEENRDLLQTRQELFDNVNTDAQQSHQEELYQDLKQLLFSPNVDIQDLQKKYYYLKEFKDKY